MQIPGKITGKYRSFFIIPFFFLSALSINAQVYSKADKKEILDKRKEVKKAIEDWNKAGLYSLGAFFEKIYDKYHDSSMTAAIRCYEMAASSESEYGDNWDSYTAAYKLAKIFETGKGTVKNLQRSLIYYYLSDSSYQPSLYQLGTAAVHPAFEKMRNEYCNKAAVIISTLKHPSSKDSVVLRISPFCNSRQLFKDSLQREIGQYLRQHPLQTAQFVLQGQSPVTAAQYTLKAENFVLPRMINEMRQTLIEEEGIDPTRISELQRGAADKEEYALVIYFKTNE